MKIQKIITMSGSVLALSLGPELMAQTTPAAQPSICVRSCWAARAPNCALTMSSALTRAIVHHTAASSDWSTTSIDTSKPKIRGIQNYHMDAQGWCDIGYHFLVDKLGNIFEGRSGSMTSLRRGIHDACNGNSFGFTLLGYFHTPYNHSPTPEMLNSYYNVIAWRMPSGWSPYGAGTYCNKTVGFLDGHRKVVATACPGDLVHPNLITENYNGGPMRSAVAARRGGFRNKVCDFNGDGKTDIGIYRPSNGQWWVENVIAGRVLGGAAGDIPVPGDYNGDGRTDIGIYRPSNGQWWVENVIAGTVFGQAGDIPVPGDYNGDGRTDMAIYKPSNGQWWVNNVIAGTVLGGAAGDIPVPGDYNGDGRTDIGIYRPSNGQWWVENVIAGRVLGGAPGDIPVPGDYNGDGRTDIGIFRPSNGQWWVENVIAGTVFGQSGDIPVPGDYNGDGRTDVGIYRPSNGQWWVVNVIGGTGLGGGAGDRPLPLPAAIRRVFFP